MNHFYFNIPGWFGFHDVYDRATALIGRDGAHFVEVGSYEGRSAAYMGVNIVNSGFKIRFDCVDSWENEIKQYDIDGNLTMTAGAPRIENGTTLGKFRSNMAVFQDLADIRFVKKKSLEAAADYKDGSLDFVFLDASHTPQDVYNDLCAWMPKIRPGHGVIAGDDASLLGVRMALMKKGMGVKANPLIMSGGEYKSWIYTPCHMVKNWVTHPPKDNDFASDEGSIEASREHLRQKLGIDLHA